MKSKIVRKIFALTSLLCMFILGAVFIGQTFFFKHYYVQKKETEITASIEKFKQEFLPNELGDDRRTKEQLFYEQTNTWITVLDQYGQTTNMNDFYIEIDVELSSQPLEKEGYLKVPLSSLMSIHEALDEDFSLKNGNQILMYGIQTDSTITPYAMSEGDIYPFAPQQEISLRAHILHEWIEIRESPLFQIGSPYWENKQLLDRVSHYMAEHSIDPPDDKVEAQLLVLEETRGGKIKYEEAWETYLGIEEAPIVLVAGSITNVHIPTYKADQTIMDYNHAFIDQLHAFQASLLFDGSWVDVDHSSPNIMDEDLNGIPHKIFILPFQVDDQTYYVFAMTSLQPVDEVLQVMEDYFIYLIIIVMILILLVSFYYSKKIANPLLKINKTTEKMARLDFSESIPLDSRDELGTLSQNINILSDTLHNYIVEL